MNTTRRGFLQKAAATTAAVLTGCGQQPEPKVTESKAEAITVKEIPGPDLFETLGKFEFIDGAGNKVGIQALKEELKDRYVTLSVGFKGCSAFCPSVNASLASIGTLEPQPFSIMVNAKPELEGVSLESRKGVETEIAKMVTHNRRVLYPTKNGKLSNDAVVALTLALGDLADPKNFDDHTTTVHLYAPGGKQLHQKDGFMNTPDSFVRDWQAVINANQTKRGIAVAH